MIYRVPSMKKKFKHFTEEDLSELVGMAISDKYTFTDIYNRFQLKEDALKKFLKNNIRQGSYLNWRKRVAKKRRTRITKMVLN